MTSSTTARPTQDQESQSVSQPSQNDKEVTHSVLLHELLDPKAKHEMSFLLFRSLRIRVGTCLLVIGPHNRCII